MGKSAENHHVTEPAIVPSVGIGMKPQPNRAVPVAVIYEIKRKADPVVEKPNIVAWPAASRSSMFFARKNRSIKDDPFLNRLSRLK